MVSVCSALQDNLHWCNSWAYANDSGHRFTLDDAINTKFSMLGLCDHQTHICCFRNGISYACCTCLVAYEEPAAPQLIDQLQVGYSTLAQSLLSPIGLHKATPQYATWCRQERPTICLSACLVGRQAGRPVELRSLCICRIPWKIIFNIQWCLARCMLTFCDSLRDWLQTWALLHLAPTRAMALAPTNRPIVIVAIA